MVATTRPWLSSESKLGETLRRLAKDVQAKGTPWDTNKGYMKALNPWQPLTPYTTGQMVVNGGNIYVAATTATSGNTGGPLGTSPSGNSEGSMIWIFWAYNYITNDPLSVQPAWLASTAYTLGQQVINGGNVYACVAAGTSAGSVGPTGTSNAITDGTVTWTYMGVYYPTRYAGIMPTVSTSASAPPGSNDYYTSQMGVFSAVAATTLPTGGGYAVGDTVTLANGGGASTTPAVLSIASVNSRFVFTVSGITTAPVASSIYTNNGVTFTVISASITAGSGTITATAIGSATASGTLVNAGGTGDASITFSSVTTTTGVPLTCTVATAGVYSALQNTLAYWAQASTSGSGTGATFNVAFTGPQWANVFGARNAYSTGTHGVAMTFCPAPQSTIKARDWVCEFYTDAETVNFAISSGNYTIIQYVIDGVSYSLDITTGLNITNGYLTFDFTNCGGRKKRLFQLYAHASNIFPSVIVPNARTVWKPENEDVITCAAISDSIWDGSGYGPFVPGNSTALRVGEELGWRNMFSFIEGGTGWINRGTSPGVLTDSFGERIVQAMTVNPDLWMFMGSTNDIGQSGITAAVTSTLQNIRALGSKAPIIVLGVWSINNAGVSVVESAVQAGVTAAADPLGKTFFIPIYNDPYLPWIGGTWNNNPAPSGITALGATNATIYVNGGDNIHPPDPGTEYLAKRIKDAIMTNVLPYL